MFIGYSFYDVFNILYQCSSSFIKINLSIELIDVNQVIPCKKNLRGILKYKYTMGDIDGSVFLLNINACLSAEQYSSSLFLMNGSAHGLIYIKKRPTWQEFINV